MATLNPQFNRLEDLAKFLVRAKKATFANTQAKEITPERPGFKELVYEEGLWSYRDSYTGFFSAPGQEVVRINGVPIWSMAYSGGMTPDFTQDLPLAKATFNFLKTCLEKVDVSAPFRGPGFFKDSPNHWQYENSHEGNIKDFLGKERIFHKGKEVFSQNYMGGIILHKS